MYGNTTPTSPTCLKLNMYSTSLDSSPLTSVVRRITHAVNAYVAYEISVCVCAIVPRARIASSTTPVWAIGQLSAAPMLEPDAVND